MNRHCCHGLACFVILVCSLVRGGNYQPVKASQDYQIAITSVDTAQFPTIQAHVSVLDPNGLPLDGLKQSNFSIIEDGKPVVQYEAQRVEKTKSPITFVIAVDTSGSMSGKPLEDTIRAIINLMDSLNPQDKVAIVTFNDSARMLLPATNDRAKISSALTQLSGTGKTALWDGIHLSINSLFSNQTGKSAVVVISDGSDTTSLLRLEDIATEANVHHIPVFSIGFGEVDRISLNRLSTLTGAQSFILPDSSEMTEKFTEIINTMRPEYLLSYQTLSNADGMEHKVGVAVDIQGTKIQSECSFIIPAAGLSVSLRGISSGQKIGAGVATLLSPVFPPKVSVSKVEYVLDRKVLAELSTSPYEFEWTPEESDAGAHTLNVRVSDLVGNTEEVFIPIMVEPPITLQINQPKEGQLLSGDMVVDLEVTGIENIASVKVYLDDQLIQELFKSPFTFTYSGKLTSPGLHTMKVMVVDVSGHTSAQQISIKTSIPNIWIFGGIGLGLVILLVVVISMSVNNRIRNQNRANNYDDNRDGIQPSPINGAAEPEIIVRKRESFSENNPVTATKELIPLARIIKSSGNTRNEEVFKLWQEITWLGASQSDDTVYLPEQGIPSRLALIKIDETGCQLIPMSNSLQITVNNQLVSAPVFLKDADVIVIGSTNLTIYLA
jgi:Ca-activated chloride channel family protein